MSKLIQLVILALLLSPLNSAFARCPRPSGETETMEGVISAVSPVMEDADARKFCRITITTTKKGVQKGVILQSATGSPCAKKKGDKVLFALGTGLCCDTGASGEFGCGIPVDTSVPANPNIASRGLSFRNGKAYGSEWVLIFKGG